MDRWMDGCVLRLHKSSAYLFSMVGHTYTLHIERLKGARRWETTTTFVREKIATVLLAIMLSDNTNMSSAAICWEISSVFSSSSLCCDLCVCVCACCSTWWSSSISTIFFFGPIITRLIEKIHNLTFLPVCRKNRLFDDGWKLTNKGPVWYGFLFIWIRLRFYEPLTSFIKSSTQFCVQHEHWSCMCMCMFFSLPSSV